jgi:hypothetical protein
MPMWFGNYRDASLVIMTIEKASTSSTESSPASCVEGVQWIVKWHFVVGGRREESVLFAQSLIQGHCQTAWRMTVLFAIFYDDFLRKRGNSWNLVVIQREPLLAHVHR